MIPLTALAAAVRDRLLAGSVAPLPGIGTLLRAHVPARVQVRDDGSRVLLPPGEAIGLAPQEADPTAIAQALARHTGAPAETAAVAFRDAVDQLEARLAVMGEVRLDGVGTFQRSSGGVRFAPTPDLVAAVNQPYEALDPVVVAPPTPEAPAPPADTPVGPTPAAPHEPAEPDAVETLLDLIVNEPPEPDLPADETTDEPEDEGAEEEATADEAHEDEATADEAHEDEATADEATPTISPSESAFADDEPIAVPFGTDDLRDHLPPTPPDHFPDPVDTPADDAEAPDDALFAEALPLAPSAETPEPPPIAPPPPDPILDAPAEPAPAETLVVAEAPRSGRGWAFLYAAAVLGLGALLLWWAAQERRADPPSVPAQAAVPAAVVPAPTVAVPDSAAAAADTLVASAPVARDSTVAPPLAVVPNALDGLPDADVRALAGDSVEAGTAWTFVLVSTPSQRDADARAARYREAGYRTGVLPARLRGRRVYQVVVGAFASRADADRLRDRLPPDAPADAWPLNLR